MSIAALMCGLAAIYVILWICARPVKILLTALAKGALGCAAMFAVNTLFAQSGFMIGINAVTFAVCAVLGVNGFIALAAIRLILM